MCDEDGVGRLDFFRFSQSNRIPSQKRVNQEAMVRSSYLVARCAEEPKGRGHSGSLGLRTTGVSEDRSRRFGHPVMEAPLRVPIEATARVANRESELAQTHHSIDLRLGWPDDHG